MSIKGYLLARGLWQLAWYDADGTRQRRAFRNVTEALNISADTESGRTRWPALARADPHAGGSSGLRGSRREAPLGSTLLEAVDFYLKRHPTRFEKKSVDQVISLLLDDLKSRGMSGAYQRTASVNLRKVARDFACPISNAPASFSAPGCANSASRRRPSKASVASS